METKKMILSVQLAFLACMVSCAGPARRAPLPQSPEAKVWVCTGAARNATTPTATARGCGTAAGSCWR